MRISISKVLWSFVFLLLFLSHRFIPGAVKFDSDIIFDSFYTELVLENGLSNSFLNHFINLSYGWPASAHFAYPLNEWVSLFIIKLLKNFLVTDTYHAFGYFILIGIVLNFSSFYLLSVLCRINKHLAIIISLSFALNLFLLTRFKVHIFFSQIWIVNIGLVLFLILITNRLKDRIFVKIILVLVSSSLLAYSNNYFILFTLLVYIFLVFLYLIKLIASNNTKTDLGNLLFAIMFIVSTLTLNSLSSTGLFKHSSFVQLLTIPESRQIVESLMFAGSPFSLFSYQNSIIYQVFNISYLDYAHNYSVLHPGWSDSLGNRFEIQILILLIFTLFMIKRIKNIDLIDHKMKILIFVTIYLFTFYFQGGLGYAFTYMLSNSVRGWGRVIFVILIFVLLVIGISVTKIIQSFNSILLFRLSVATLTIFLIIPAAVDLSRLSNSQVVEVYESEQSDLRGVFSSLSSLEDNCPVVVLPYYPFPEFDSPNDRLSDYDLLALPMFDVENKFKWNVGAIKWSEDDRWWSPLASDIPGFASADALTQISFASHYGACAIALNQGMFKTQDLEVKPSFLTQFECPLLGNFPNSTPANSWMVWDIRGKTCQDKILINAKLAPNTFPNDPDGPLLWRFTNISPEKYEANYPIFSSRSPVGIDFMSISNKERADKPKLAIKIMENQQNEILNLKICVTEIEKMKEQCEEIEIKGNENDYQLKKYLTGKKHHINITPKTAQNEIKWAPLITY